MEQVVRAVTTLFPVGGLQPKMVKSIICIFNQALKDIVIFW